MNFRWPQKQYGSRSGRPVLGELTNNAELNFKKYPLKPISELEAEVGNKRPRDPKPLGTPHSEASLQKSSYPAKNSRVTQKSPASTTSPESDGSPWEPVSSKSYKPGNYTRKQASSTRNSQIRTKAWAKNLQQDSVSATKPSYLSPVKNVLASANLENINPDTLEAEPSHSYRELPLERSYTINIEETLEDEHTSAVFNRVLSFSSAIDRTMEKGESEDSSFSDFSVTMIDCSPAVTRSRPENHFNLTPRRIRISQKIPSLHCQTEQPPSDNSSRRASSVYTYSAPQSCGSFSEGYDFSPECESSICSKDQIWQSDYRRMFNGSADFTDEGIGSGATLAALAQCSVMAQEDMLAVSNVESAAGIYQQSEDIPNHGLRTLPGLEVPEIMPINSSSPEATCSRASLRRKSCTTDSLEIILPQDCLPKPTRRRSCTIDTAIIQDETVCPRKYVSNIAPRSESYSIPTDMIEDEDKRARMYISRRIHPRSTSFSLMEEENKSHNVNKTRRNRSTSYSEPMHEEKNDLHISISSSLSYTSNPLHRSKSYPLSEQYFSTPRNAASFWRTQDHPGLKDWGISKKKSFEELKSRLKIILTLQSHQDESRMSPTPFTTQLDGSRQSTKTPLFSDDKFDHGVQEFSVLDSPFTIEEDEGFTDLPVFCPVRSIEKHKSKSLAKCRRVSLGIKTRAALIKSEAPAAKTRPSVLAHRKANAVTGSYGSSHISNSASFSPFQADCVSKLSGHPAPSPKCVMEDFKGKDIIGGTLQSVKGGRPVITSPGCENKKIIAANLTKDGGIELCLWKSQTETTSTIRFSAETCHAIRAHPTGILLSKNHEKEMYFLRDQDLFNFNGILDEVTPFMSEKAGKYEMQIQSPRKPVINETKSNMSVDEIMLEVSNISIGSPGILEIMDIELVEPEQAPIRNDESIPSCALDSCSDLTKAEKWRLFVPVITDIFSWIVEDKNSLGNTCKGLKIEIQQHTAAHEGFLYAKLMEDLDNPPKALKSCSYKSMVEQFHWGQFLSEGAVKQVFRVWSSERQCYVAVSVMDLDSIYDMGTGAIVCQELQISRLMTSLLAWGHCPNFVQIYDTFRCSLPPNSIWGSKDNRCPQGTSYNGKRPGVKLFKPPNNVEVGNYQYIVMELCSNGDVEEYMSKLSQGQFCLKQIKSLMFQMIISLYSAQRVFGLRHYDVKLLNFLLKETDAKQLVYEVDDQKYVIALDMKKEPNFIAKLADFGTADVSSLSSTQKIGIDQFTTLENTPIEYLLLGDKSSQSFSADAFCLGLSMIHLYTGTSPYEEILKDVKAPRSFYSKVSSIWEGPSDQYDVIKKVISDFDEEEDKRILYDTLYRFLVLLGIPNRSEMETYTNQSPILEAIYQLQLSNNDFRKQFMSDVTKFSLWEGEAPLMQRARKNLSVHEGSTDLLKGLVHFDPFKRFSMPKALKQPMFKEYQFNPDKNSIRRSSCRRAVGKTLNFKIFLSGGSS